MSGMSVIRYLEILEDRHAHLLVKRKPASADAVRLAKPVAKKPAPSEVRDQYRMTEAIHDAVFLRAHTLPRVSIPRLSRTFGISPSIVSKIRRRVHPKYDAARCEALLPGPFTQVTPVSR